MHSRCHDDMDIVYSVTLKLLAANGREREVGYAMLCGCYVLRCNVINVKHGNVGMVT